MNGSVVRLPTTEPATRPADRWSVDDWGRDPSLVRLTVRLGRLRWKVTLGGTSRLPSRRGGLIVVNARRCALTPIVTALAVGDAIGRPVRFTGRPDVAPVGPFLRRLGGLLDRPDEIAGALRAGELVVVGTEPALHPRRVGRLDHRLAGAARATNTAIFPAAALASPFSRKVRIEIGPSARTRRRQRGPLDELELTEMVERRIQLLLDELGASSGTLLDWLWSPGAG